MTKCNLISKCLACILLVVTTSVDAQTSQDPQSYISPSPTAMAFQKYGDYPVDISTGVPSIDIPLYTIGVKGYSFPISASFHASGRSTAQNFSPLGMNWSLMANGSITKEVRGQIDGTGATHLEKNPTDLTPQSSSYNDLQSIDPNPMPNTGIAPQDPEYDIYTLSINGISAKFIIRYHGQNNYVTFLNYCPYTVNSINPFTVLDDKGILYTFGADGIGNGFTEFNYGNGQLSYPSGWYVASIVTPAGGSIKFKYDNQSIQSASYMGNRSDMDQLTVKDCGTYLSGFEPTFYTYYPSSNNVPIATDVLHEDGYSMLYLKEIDFDNGVASFSYTSTASNFLLDKFKVVSTSNTIVRNVQFNYFMQLPGTDLVLKNNNSVTIQNIQFEDAANTLTEQYGFDYYPGTAGGDLTTFIKTKDWWGYCNVSTSAKKMPFTTISMVQLPPGGTSTYNTYGSDICKIPDFNSKLVGMVRSIHYPTGGSTTFTYEANKYNNYLGNVVDGPGIRVKQIVSYDGLGHQTGKTYSYGPGKIVREPQTTDYYTEVYNMIFSHGDIVLSNDWIGSFRYTVYSSEPIPEVQIANRCPVTYASVTEYDYAADNSKNGKTDYVYTYPYSYSYSTTVNPPSNYTVGGFSYYPNTFSYYEWSHPLLTIKAVEKFDPASSTYKTITQKTINYNQFDTLTVPQTCLYKFLMFPDDQFWLKTVIGSSYNWPVYSLMDKTISTAIMKPVSEINITYDDNGNSLADTTTYYYDNAVHMNPTRIQHTTSDFKTLTQYISYPSDYPSGTSFIDGLMGKHIWQAPIEEVTVQTNAGISRVVAGYLTTYAGINPYQIYKLEPAAPVDPAGFKISNLPLGTLPPATKTPYAPDNSYQLKLTYNNYDAKSNPLTITPTGNMPISYIWGYNQTYPIANVKNAVYTDIFYTGFEETEANSTSGDSKAGLWSHTGGYTHALSGLSNGNYQLSYWQKSGSAWALQASTITVTGGSYTISLTGQVDEVRFYPSTAQMTSYTYTPLVGLTSQSDINHFPTLFEYDSYNRLLHVRDKDLNVIKKYAYSILNTPYYSNARTVAVTKNDCDPLVYVGSSVNYTVDDYAYSSTISQTDANNKRDADIAQNQQTYANINGTCYNYQNMAVSKVFVRACGASLYGTSYTYNVPYAKWTGLTQAAADQKAQDDINANGQNAANSDPSGACLTYAQVYKNAAVTQTFTKSCPFGYAASTYTYTVPYAKYISANSQAEADNLANADLVSTGVTTVNTHSCNALPTTTIQVSNSTNYAMNITFSCSGGSTSYTVPANTPNGSMVVLTGQTWTVSIYPAGGNTFHFYVGSSSSAGSSAYFQNIPAGNVQIQN